MVSFRWWTHDPGWPGWNSVAFCRDPGSTINSSKITYYDYMWKVSSRQGGIPFLYYREEIFSCNLIYHVILGWNLSQLEGLKFHLGKPGSRNHHPSLIKLKYKCGSSVFINLPKSCLGTFKSPIRNYFIWKEIWILAI